MRVLVLGAGVLGSYLAHSLLKTGNDVTILARGTRYEQLSDKGLVIKHYFQKKTTVERVNVISELKIEDRYDLVFVVLKYNQVPSVLDTIAHNVSENIIFIGNHADPKRTEAEILKLSATNKRIGFGFQTSAGLREASGRVVSIHGKGNITFGDLNGDVTLRQTVQQAFGNHYKVIIEDDIEAWLLTHYVFVTPMNSLLYFNDFNARAVSKSKASLLQLVEATNEGMNVLRGNGVNITPVSLGKLIRDHKKLYYLFMKIFFKLPMNNYVSGGFDEIIALYRDFEKLKSNLKIPMTNWNSLENGAMKKYRMNEQ